MILIKGSSGLNQVGSNQEISFDWKHKRTHLSYSSHPSCDSNHTIQVKYVWFELELHIQNQENFNSV